MAYTRHPPGGFGDWQSGFVTLPGGRVIARIREVDRWGIPWEAVLPEHGSVPISVAAKLFRVTAMTIHNWIAAGFLPTHKKHGMQVVPMRNLIDLATERGILSDEEDQFPYGQL